MSRRGRDEPTPVGTPLPEHLGGPPARRRRGCLFWALVVGGVAALLVIGLVAAVVLYNRTHQDLELPANGAPIPTSPPVTRAESPGVEMSSMNVTQGANQRHVAILSPTAARPDEKLPLVVLLHGHSTSSGVVVADGNWRAAIVEHRFMVAAPDGVANSWNAGPCCRPATLLDIDDEAFLAAIIRDLVKRPNVNPSRVYMVGVSNGGMMMYEFLCEHGDLVDGGASVEGTNMTLCQPRRPVPVLHIAGTADRVVPYGGGRSTAGTLLASGEFPAVERSMEKIAVGYGCPTEPAVNGDQQGVTLRDWTNCSGGGRVELATIADLAHVYPRGTPYDATDRIVAFLGLGTPGN